MIARLDLFVPTRARPLNVDRLLASIEETAARPERVRCFFRVDSDDTATQEASESLRARHPKVRVQFIVGERVPLAWMYTQMAKMTDGDILWSGGDDIVFRTPGWDDEIVSEFNQVPDRILLVYGNDCLQEHRLATHPFISRKSFDVLGYFFPNTGQISVTDLWLHEAYRAIGRLKYRPDIVTEHMHWLRRDKEGNHLAEYDLTYAGQYEKNMPEVMATLQSHQDYLFQGMNALARAIGSASVITPRYPAPKETLMPSKGIHGKGSHGLVILDAIHALNPGEEVKRTDDAEGTRPYSGDLFICGIGDNRVRKEKGGSLTVIHPRAAISSTAGIGRGVFVGANAFIGPKARVGNGAIINNGAIVEHECVIGSYAHVASGAVLSGGVQVGEGTLIGAGAVVRPWQKVGKWCVIGAGAVVTRDVPDGETWVGVPAAPMEKHCRAAAPASPMPASRPG